MLLSIIISNTSGGSSSHRCHYCFCGRDSIDNEIFLTWTGLAPIRSYVVNIKIKMNFCHCDHFPASERELWQTQCFLLISGVCMLPQNISRSVSRQLTFAIGPVVKSIPFSSFGKSSQNFLWDLLLKMQILRSCPRPTVQAILGVGPSNLCILIRFSR